MEPVRKIITMPPELAERIADFRFEERIGSEAEALRQLIIAGLESRELSRRSRKGERG